MKRIDKQTERRLYWLFTPMAIVVVALILELWFGVDLKFMTWYQPALLGSLLIGRIFHSRHKAEMLGRTGCGNDHTDCYAYQYGQFFCGLTNA